MIHQWNTKKCVIACQDMQGAWKPEISVKELKNICDNIISLIQKRMFPSIWVV